MKFPELGSSNPNKAPLLIKNAAFIAYKDEKGEFKLVGTVFFVGLKSGNGYKVFAVTAKHVLEETYRNLRHEDFFIRFNDIPSGGANWFGTNLKDWRYHSDSSVDVATTEFPYKFQDDIHYLGTEQFITPLLIQSAKVAVGAEVSIAGLFHYHSGVNSNIPIIRSGHIAAIPQEKIYVNDRDRELILLDCTSTRGLSGSPVFMNDQENKTVLIGLIHGHYQDKIEGNTNIAMVVPAYKILEILEEII